MSSKSTTKSAPRIRFLVALSLDQFSGGEEGASKSGCSRDFHGRNSKDESSASQHQRLNVISPILELWNAKNPFESCGSGNPATQVESLCEYTTKQRQKHCHSHHHYRLPLNSCTVVHRYVSGSRLHAT
jgi:hypothetical protein